MFQLGNKLARILNNTEYSKKADTVWKWINKARILNMTTYQVWHYLNTQVTDFPPLKGV